MDKVLNVVRPIEVVFTCMFAINYVFLLFLHFYNGVDLLNAASLAVAYVKEYPQHESLYIFLDGKVLGAKLVWKAIQEMITIIICGHATLFCRIFIIIFHNHTQQQDA